MLNIKGVLSICTCVMFLLLGITLAGQGPVGTVSLGSDSLSVSPTVPYGELRIIVAGKGVYLEERYAPDEGTTLFFGQLEDGLYKYEIIAAPDMGETMDEDRKEDPAIEEKEKANTFIQSGSFTVTDCHSELNVRTEKRPPPNAPEE